MTSEVNWSLASTCTRMYTHMYTHTQTHMHTHIHTSATDTYTQSVTMKTSLGWRTCRPYLTNGWLWLWLGHIKQTTLWKIYWKADCNCVDFKKCERISHTGEKTHSTPREGILKVISQSGNKIKADGHLIGFGVSFIAFLSVFVYDNIMQCQNVWTYVCVWNFACV